MNRSALGIRMHSGWGVVVAVSGDVNSIEVIDRRRIVTMDSSMPGAKQPYHFAANLAAAESEGYLARCAVNSERLSLAAIKEIVRDLEIRQYYIAGCALMLASGRPLPILSKILSSHPLIHSAEGQFFRDGVRKACERLKIPVAAIPERQVEERARKIFGKGFNEVQSNLSSIGKSLRPPWTKD